MQCCNIAVAELDFVSYAIEYCLSLIQDFRCFQGDDLQPRIFWWAGCHIAEGSTWVAHLFLSPSSVCCWIDVHLLLQNFNPDSTWFTLNYFCLISLRNTRTVLNRTAWNRCSLLPDTFFAHTELTNCFFSQHIWITNTTCRPVSKIILMNLKQSDHSKVKISSGSISNKINNTVLSDDNTSYCDVLSSHANCPS